MYFFLRTLFVYFILQKETFFVCVVSLFLCAFAFVQRSNNNVSTISLLTWKCCSRSTQNLFCFKQTKTTTEIKFNLNYSWNEHFLARERKKEKKMWWWAVRWFPLNSQCSWLVGWLAGWIVHVKDAIMIRKTDLHRNNIWHSVTNALHELSLTLYLSGFIFVSDFFLVQILFVVVRCWRESAWFWLLDPYRSWKWGFKLAIMTIWKYPNGCSTPSS